MGFGLLLAGALAVVAVAGGKPGGRAPAASGDGGLEAGALVEPGDAGVPDDAGEPTEPAVVPGMTVDAGGTLLITGQVPPPLDAEAPKSVVFGVILVTYRGAQGAPAGSRTRDAALTLAKELATEAKADFKAAVAKGDKGSSENLGRMNRGILEPAPEYVLFSLPKGAVSDPVDTPRGYWVVTRIE
ncbi:MAG: peptidyl-prolyl cis-trans isomerase [Polyangiaceae bacterium]